MSPKHDDDEELELGDGNSFDDDARTPVTDVATHAWRRADLAVRLARRHARELELRAMHLFGRPRFTSPPNPEEPGRLARTEAEVAKLKAITQEHQVRFETLDRIQWKIIAAATVGGGLVTLAVTLIRFFAGK